MDKNPKVNIKEEMKRYKEILDDFLKDFDMKRLTADFFVKLYNAEQFGRFKRTDVLSLNFEYGPYEFKLQRRVKPSTQMKQSAKNTIIQGALAGSDQMIARAKYFDNIIKNRKW